MRIRVIVEPEEGLRDPPPRFQNTAGHAIDALSGGRPGGLSPSPAESNADSGPAE